MIGFAVLLAVVLLVVLIRLKKISKELDSRSSAASDREASRRSTGKTETGNRTFSQTASVQKQVESRTVMPKSAHEQDESRTIMPASFHEQNESRTVMPSEHADRSARNSPAGQPRHTAPSDRDKTVFSRASSPADDEDGLTVYQAGGAADRDEEQTVMQSSHNISWGDDRTSCSPADDDDGLTVYQASRVSGRDDDDLTVLGSEGNFFPTGKSKRKNTPDVRVCLLNKNTGDTWKLILQDDKPVLIGRDTACQVHLNEKSVSRCQCVLFSDRAGKPVIENKSLSNITKLNGYALNSPQILREDDEIQCGRISLVAVSVSSL